MPLRYVRLSIEDPQDMVENEITRASHMHSQWPILHFRFNEQTDEFIIVNGYRNPPPRDSPWNPISQRVSFTIIKPEEGRQLCQG
jgi:hypothetical protein